MRRYSCDARGDAEAMPPSLPMMPSGMPSALFHMTSVANVKARPSHT